MEKRGAHDRDIVDEDTFGDTDAPYGVVQDS
jgi:hypothetical protein